MKGQPIALAFEPCQPAEGIVIPGNISEKVGKQIIGPVPPLTTIVIAHGQEKLLGTILIVTGLNSERGLVFRYDASRTPNYFPINICRINISVSSQNKFEPIA